MGERLQRAERLRKGIEIDAHTWSEIEAAAAKVGVRLNDPSAGNFQSNTPVAGE